MSRKKGLSHDMRENVRDLVTLCERAEPPFSSLGTPSVGLNNASQKVIDLGATGVPYLCELLPAATSHAAAYIAFCLGRIGDRGAIPALKESLRVYENKINKGPFDYAFIGNAREALEKIKP